MISRTKLLLASVCDNVFSFSRKCIIIYLLNHIYYVFHYILNDRLFIYII